MGERGADAVEARIQRLGTDDLVAFVADLWAARGYDTTREDDLVLAGRDGRSVTIAVRGRSRSLPVTDRAVDVVVAPAGLDGAQEPDGARLLDAADLREMVWYALDAEDRTRLCARQFGAPPSELSLPWRDRVASRLHRARPTPLSGRDGSVPVGGSVTAIVVVGLAVLVGVSTVTGALLATDGPGSSGEGVPETTPVALQPTTTTTATEALPPPGVTAAGITNLTALSNAHDRVLDGRSYTVWMDRYQSMSTGESWAQRDVDVAVSGDRYLAEVETGGEGNRRTLGLVYYDGADWFVANRSSGERYRRVPGNSTAPLTVPDPFVLRRSLVTRYLSTPETAVVTQTIVEGRRLYRIVARGTPAADGFEGVSDYTAIALVDRRGVVHDLTVEYVKPNRPGSPRVHFEATYGEFGNSSVSAPPWYERRFASPPPGTPDSTVSNTSTTPTRAQPV